jgi:hypothetical protein
MNIGGLFISAFRYAEPMSIVATHLRCLAAMIPAVAKIDVIATVGDDQSSSRDRFWRCPLATKRVFSLIKLPLGSYFSLQKILDGITEDTCARERVSIFTR